MDIVNDYDYEILYHPSNVNVVAGALSRKTTSAPIRDLFLTMTMVTLLLEIIKEVRTKPASIENHKRKRVKGQVTSYVRDSRGLLFVDLIWSDMGVICGSSDFG